MSPRTLKLNAHRTLAYYTPEDVEEMRRADQSRIAELEMAIAGCVDLAEWWINHKRDPRMSDSAYAAWLSLGHHSGAMVKAKAAINHARSNA